MKYIEILIWGYFTMILVKPGLPGLRCPDRGEVRESPLQLGGEDGVGAQGGADHAGQTRPPGTRQGTSLLNFSVHLRDGKRLILEKKESSELFIEASL